MKNKIIALILSISFSHCTPVLKLYYGYHQPKTEDSKSLTKYYKKKGVEISNMVILADSVKYYERFNEVHIFPEIRVFNKEGYLVYYRDTVKSCNAPAYEFTDSICKLSNLKFNSSKNLESETKGLLTLNNMPLQLTTSAGYDYYVFIYSARFAGRLNKDHVKVWERNLENAKGCKVKYYLVDMDWQKSWGQLK
jgi:hypothetical protein